jgi:hypothetical protein
VFGGIVAAAAFVIWLGAACFGKNLAS